jgi:hypothetical protein
MNHRQTNILRVYHLASGEEIASGSQWYHAAHDEAVRLSSPTHSVRITAAVIAALSPGLRWERNVEAAERVIRGGTTLYDDDELGGLGVRWYDGVRKAERILAGRNPAIVLQGPKVRAFWHCIAQPDSTLAVCVDGHAYSIWAGQRLALDDIPPFNERMYTRISGDYAAVASHVGIRPCQIQAICWVAWRRLHGV